MSLYHRRPLTRRLHLVLSSFMQATGLGFAKVLSEEQIEQAFAEEGVAFAQNEAAVFTPAVTLGAFLSQVLYKDEQRSCLAAVSRVIVLWVSLGRAACAKNRGPYCRARAKLCEPVIKRLTLEVARGCECETSDAWLWHGHHVKLVDGTTVSMPDTPENQEALPQPNSQEPGLGFPVARIVVLISLATAMRCDMALGPYAGKETGETALFRKLIDQLDPGDILLADRYYGSYFMMAMLMQAGVDIVARLHQCRQSVLQREKRLGKGDYLIEWQRPAKPDWMDQATYESMPASITRRQLEVKVAQPGFRVASLIVVTTLLDAKKYAKQELAELYHKRWLVELDIRTIKDTLGMDVLRCKTPHRVRNEIWTCLLAYNLIRKSMLEAAAQSGLSPRQLSFTRAMQTVAASWMTLATTVRNALLIEVQLHSLTEPLIGKRPHRIEPRAVKRRPKPHKLLTEPRAVARAQLLAGVLESAR